MKTKRTVLAGFLELYTCSKCKEDKLVEEFSACSITSSGAQSWCKECKKKKGQEDRASGKVRRQRLKHDYNISEEDYKKLLNSQSSLCRGCMADFRVYTRIPAIDHCHKTGKVRGILCDSCNMVLGGAFDDPSVLRSLANYLEETNTAKVK